jgi:nucleoside-diphosphate-sugar epimerase
VYTYISKTNEEKKPMRIFITGASGYVGSVVSEKAVKAGHTVLGLARSDSSASKLEQIGVMPVLGNLGDLGLLNRTAKEADAVLHLGFVHEFDRPYDELLAIDIAAIESLANGLLNTNKALIMTSGTGVVEADNGKETCEDSPVSQGLGIRVRAEEAALKFAEQGVRSMAIRLAPYVYGRGGSYFVPINMQAAAKYGFAPYVGDGLKMTTAADVDAAADLYLLAMEKGKAGSVFNCSTETDVVLKDLATAIGKSLDVGIRQVTAEQSNEMCGPFTAHFLQVENRASNQKAKRELGWQPAPTLKLLDDIVKGSYRALAEKLKSEGAIAR